MADLTLTVAVTTGTQYLTGSTSNIFTFDGEFFYWKGRSDNIVKRSGWKTVKKN